MNDNATTARECREALALLDAAIGNVGALLFGMQGGIAALDRDEDSADAEAALQVARLRDLADGTVRQAQCLLTHIKFLASRLGQEAPGSSPP